VSSGDILLSPPQTPWTYNGSFSVVSTLSPFFGNVSSFEGRLFCVLNASTIISQDLTNLQPGSTYFISWLQQKNTSSPSSIGLNVYVNEKLVYNETDVIDGNDKWNFKTSDKFTASGSNVSLVFSTTNSAYPSSSIGIDNILVNIYYFINDP
jgi:hypothetical protein